MDTEAGTDKKDTEISALRKLYSAGRKMSVKDIDAVTYILEKTTRVSGVLVMLGELMDTHVALRDSLEETSIGLVRDAAFSLQSDNARQSLMSRLVAVGALLDAAVRAGLLSEKNVTVVVEELSALATFIGDLSWHEGRRFIDTNAFSVTVPESVFRPDVPVEDRETPLRHMRDTRSTTQQGSERSYTVSAPTDDKDKTEAERTHYRERVQDVQKDRRATILGLLQRKDRITVKDVANVIKDCSEKTLQRELLALVAQGVLKKEGERRWSSYRLA